MSGNSYAKSICVAGLVLSLLLSLASAKAFANDAENGESQTESDVSIGENSDTDTPEEMSAPESPDAIESSSATEEPDVTEETVTTEPPAQNVTYDSQPGTEQEVQAAIDEYNAEYQAVLAESGFLAALEVAKPRWESEVVSSIMPEGYHCELVTDDEDFGAGYYTFFISATVMTTEPWGAGGIVVETEAEFRTALQNSAYTTIYLGADITMASSSSATVAQRSLVINGTDPRPSGTRHTYTDYNNGTASATLRGPCTDITFQDITVYINTYYGIYYPTANNATTTLDGVTGQAAQFYYGLNYTSTLVIKDSELVLRITHTYMQELVENVGTVRFEGEVSVTKKTESTASNDEIFYLTGSNSTVEVAAGAAVTLNNDIPTGSSGGAIFYNVGNFTVGMGASFICNSTTGFADPGGSGALGSVTVGTEADVRFICTTSHYWGSSGLRGTSFTARAGSNFLIYNVDTTTAYGAFHFTNIALNNPESFVVLNPSSAAIGTNTCYLNATSVSSIRYYPSSAISGLFDTDSYAYMPTVEYSRFWIQSAPFNVSTTTSWTNTSPTISTNYGAPSASTAETSITSSNFSARSVYGIEIYGGSYTISGTVSGLVDNSNLTITYKIDDGVEQAVTTDPNGYYTINGVAYGAKVVITPPAGPPYYDLSPTSITLDSITAASTDNDFIYTKIAYKVTEKYVDEAGNSIQNDTTAEVFADQSYTFAGTTDNIIAGTDSYVYQGYRLDSYTAGDTLDDAGTPSNISLTDDMTVYYVYKKQATLGSITIEKYGDNGGGTALLGAEFTIERWDSDAGAWLYIEYDSVTGTWTDTTSGSTFYTQTTAGTEGNTTFAALPLNEYRIQEVASPTGYVTLMEPVIAEIPYTIDDTYPNYGIVTGGKPPDNTVLDSVRGVTTAYYYNITYTITDMAVIHMPAAGGGVSPAVLMFAGMGIALTAVTGYIFYRRRRAVNHFSAMA